VADSDD